MILGLSPKKQDELGRVLERGEEINESLLRSCAYYPIFRFIEFISEDTGEPVKGFQYICKQCSTSKPFRGCRHSVNLLW